ncbi:MAG: S9 family peptidase [Saprospiraceae bacterium]|nr:S9 family peptidase [Saprospiraceae bacterium]
MRNKSIITSLISIGMMISCRPMNNQQELAAFDTAIPAYPDTRMDTISDNYFGNSVPDPYRWLEDDRSDETADWVKRQNELTFSYLDKIPFREALKQRMEQFFNYARVSTPVKKSGHYYFFKNNGLQNQDVLFGTDSLGKEPRLIIDPNLFSKDGTSSMSGYSFSKDGKYMAFQVSDGGSDWNKILVLDLEKNEVLNDTIRWVKFSNAEWRGDGFYYSCYPTPEGENIYSAKNEFHSVYFHKIGTSQSEDKLIYVDKKNPLRNAGASLTDDERFLILSTTESTSGNALAIMDLVSGKAEFKWIVKAFDSDYNIIGNLGDEIFVHTNAGSPNWKVCSFKFGQADPSSWKDVITEGADRIASVRFIGGKLIVTFIHNAYHAVKIFNPGGEMLHELNLPELGTVGGFTGDQNDEESFYAFTSFVRPNTVYRLDLNTFKSELFFAPEIKDYNPDLFTTSQVWYKSKDSTSVSMFLTHRKELKFDPASSGQHPTILYGYGGFDISILPSFSVSRLILLENDGIFAVANIRGGGEFGANWHNAGTKEKKQNVFDDFMAAADFLVDQNYTKRAMLAIEGRSNGGLLVGACMTQRPDLCKVAFPGVGVLDMLRYHKFTIGWAWATDYGTSESEDGFEYLSKYSPLHNLKPADYPATLVITADHDDRVVPAHSFKFGAALQKAQQGKNPCLIRIDVSAGHGAGKPTTKRLEESADMLSFMFFNMQLQPKLK